MHEQMTGVADSYGRYVVLRSVPAAISRSMRINIPALQSVISSHISTF